MAIPVLLAVALLACEPAAPTRDEVAAPIAAADASSSTISAPNSMPAASGAAATLLPPGAAIGVSGGGEWRFTSRQAPATLLAWYRRGGDARAFTVGGELQEGAEDVLNGTLHRPRATFSVRLAPGPGGGTDGVLLLDRRR